MSYKINIKNKNTGTTWVVNVLSDAASDSGEEDDSSNYGLRSSILVELLEDTDLESDIRELSDQVLDTDLASIKWDDRCLRLVVKATTNETAIDFINSVREHLENYASIESDNPEEI